MDQPEVYTQADLLDAFGITTDPPAPAPTEPPADPTPEPTPDPAPAADPEPTPGTDPEPAPEPEPTPAPVPDKANQAFAQLRVENTAFKNTLQNVANILGISDVKDPMALAEAIQAKALEAQAKKENVPLEMLQRLSKMEQLEQEITQEKLRTKAVSGFEQIAKEFQLAEADVLAFAQQLQEIGMNPLEQEFDMVAVYRTLNWETLMAKAVEKGRQEEAARAAKAGQHSTEPGAIVGGTPGAQDKISTVKELDNLFNSLNL